MRSPGLLTAFSLLLLVTVSVVGAGCATTGAGAGYGNSTEAGAVLYRKRCIRCHALHSPGSFTDAQWRNILPEMAAEARMPEDEIPVLLDWLLAQN